MADLLCKSFGNTEIIDKLKEQNVLHKRFLQTILDAILVLDHKVLNGTIRNENLWSTFSDNFTDSFEKNEIVDRLDIVQNLSNETNSIVFNLKEYHENDNILAQSKLQEAVLNLQMHLHVSLKNLIINCEYIPCTVVCDNIYYITLKNNFTVFYNILYLKIYLHYFTLFCLIYLKAFHTIKALIPFSYNMYVKKYMKICNLF